MHYHGCKKENSQYQTKHLTKIPLHVNLLLASRLDCLSGLTRLASGDAVLFQCVAAGQFPSLHILAGKMYTLQAPIAPFSITILRSHPSHCSGVKSIPPTSIVVQTSLPKSRDELHKKYSRYTHFLNVIHTGLRLYCLALEGKTMIIDRCGGCESKSEIFYIGGYMYCMDCLERIDQQLITDWASEVAIPEQKTSVSEHLSQMFGSSKFTVAD